MMKRFIFYTFVVVAIMVLIYLYKSTETPVFLTDIQKENINMHSLAEFHFYYFSVAGGRQVLDGNLIAAR